VLSYDPVFEANLGAIRPRRCGLRDGASAQSGGLDPKGGSICSPLARSIFHDTSYQVPEMWFFAVLDCAIESDPTASVLCKQCRPKSARAVQQDRVQVISAGRLVGKLVA
jgi:hypothetical protein